MSFPGSLICYLYLFYLFLSSQMGRVQTPTLWLYEIHIYLYLFKILGQYNHFNLLHCHIRRHVVTIRADFQQDMESAY